MSDYIDVVLASVTDDLRQCSTAEELVNVLEGLTSSLGCVQFAYHSYLPTLNEVNTLTNINHDWVKCYQDNDYRLFDPRLLYLVRNDAPIYWDQIKLSNGATGKLQQKILNEAAEFGLGEGMTIPIHGPGSEVAALNISAPKGELPEFNYSDRCILKMLGYEVHKTFKCIRLGSVIDHGVDLQLTPKESETVKWTVAGKTAWEISQILGCSESTVVFHLKNVSKKLNTSNRAQTVAKVHSDALIKQFASLDEGKPEEISEHVHRLS